MYIIDISMTYEFHSTPINKYFLKFKFLQIYFHQCATLDRSAAAGYLQDLCEFAQLRLQLTVVFLQDDHPPLQPDK